MSLRFTMMASGTLLVGILGFRPIFRSTADRPAKCKAGHHCPRRRMYQIRSHVYDIKPMLLWELR